MTQIKDKSLIRYIPNILSIIRYQLLTKMLLTVIVGILHFIRDVFLWTTSRSAFSSGDLSMFFKSWQGWVVIILYIIILLVYLVFDIVAMLLLSEKILHQKPVKVMEILKEALHSIRYFLNVKGLLLLFYVAFLLPIAGIGLGISLTARLYIPNFITSVISTNAIYTALYTIALIAIFVVVFFYIFTFHFIIFDHKEVGIAVRDAGRMMRKNWKDFIKRYGLFFLKTFLVGAFIVLGTITILFIFAILLPESSVSQFRFNLSLFSYIVLSIAELYILLFTPFQFLQLTRLYESYTEKDEGDILYPSGKPWKKKLGICVLIYSVFISLLAYGSTIMFDELFPDVGQTIVIAHRAGGTLGNENTAYGLEQAIKEGAQGSEIDIQRTADGYYILNHDDTLLRLSGVDAKVSELTLAEIKKLQVPNNFNFLEEDKPYATYEEILDISKDKLHLYVELKGETADEQMADDLYRITKEYGMLDQVTFICLNYPLISYFESTYPDASTGYLCYAAIGDLEYLDVDVLILEEELATPRNIENIHSVGKQVLVWTVNETTNMIRFMARGADGIITDEVSQAMDVHELINLEFDEEDNDELQDVKRVLLQTVFVLWP